MSKKRPPITRIRPYDDYNQSRPRNDGIIGTVTTMWGRDSERHGWKLLIEYGETIKF